MLIYQRVNHWIFHDFPIDFFPPNSPIQTFTSFRIIPPSCMRMAVRFSFRSSSGRLSFCRRLWRMMGCNQVPQMTLKWDGQNCLVLYPMKHSISYSILLYIVLYGYIYIYNIYMYMYMVSILWSDDLDDLGPIDISSVTTQCDPSVTQTSTPAEALKTRKTQKPQFTSNFFLGDLLVAIYSL